MSKKTCFVVSIIGSDDSNERKHANSVLDHIIEPALANEFEIVRADKIYHADKIDDKIFKHLRESDLVVADLTGYNPNVFLEIGYRLALKLPTVYMIQKSDNRLPFDIQSINILHYDLKSDNVLDEAKTARERLAKTVKALKFDTIQNTTENETSSDLLNEILVMLYNINDKIDTLSIEPIVEPDISTNTMQLKLIEQAMENPDKFEKLANIISNNPNLFGNN